MTSACFTRTELCQLLESALSHTADNSGALLRVAVKACGSVNVPMRDVLWQVFERITVPDKTTLRRWCRNLARIGQLEELATLLAHSSAPVRIAVLHAFYLFGTHAHV